MDLQSLPVYRGSGIGEGYSHRESENSSDLSTTFFRLTIILVVFFALTLASMYFGVAMVAAPAG